jgi:hypothetical protein
MTARELRRADDRFLSAWDMPGWLILVFVIAFCGVVLVLGVSLGKSAVDYADRLATKQCEREAVALGTDPGACHARK